MKNKQDILDEIRAALSSGLITAEDLKILTNTQSDTQLPSSLDKTEKKSSKVSAVDVMFYVAGIILYATILSFIVQSWEETSRIVHIAVTIGVGSLLWSLVYILNKKEAGLSDTSKGLSNALLLTGSFCLITGGYIILNEVTGGYDTTNYFGGAFTLAVLSIIHIFYDRLIKRDLVFLLGVLLGVMAFPSLLFGVLQGADITTDIYTLITIATAGLLAYATRVAAKVREEKTAGLSTAFDSLAVFVTLLSIYIASFGENALVWLLCLVASILGLFYLSIVYQNKNFLRNASIFLVLAIITIAFKYFSGYGITFSLGISVVGLIGSAVAASSINKKYFKK